MYYIPVLLESVKKIVFHENENWIVVVVVFFNEYSPTCNSFRVIFDLFPPSISLFMMISQTFSQLCSFDYSTKTVQIYKAPWSIRDKPRFPFRGLMLGEPIYFVKEATLYLVSVHMQWSKAIDTYLWFLLFCRYI